LLKEEKISVVLALLPPGNMALRSLAVAMALLFAVAASLQVRKDLRVKAPQAFWFVPFLRFTSTVQFFAVPRIVIILFRPLSPF
jgi:hypothetical protein